jgi:hypothetical protein
MPRFEPATLPRTKAWRQVLHLLSVDGTIPQIAAATVVAARLAFRTAEEDPTLLRTEAFLEALRPTSDVEELGAQLREHISDLRNPITALELLGAIPNALIRDGEERGNSALAELATLALTEVLSEAFRGKGLDPFDAGACQIMRALNVLTRPDQKHRLRASFWGVFLYRSLQYFLSRETSNRVGERRRFRSSAELETWCHQLKDYCLGMAESFLGLRRVVHRFSPQLHIEDERILPALIKCVADA